MICIKCKKEIPEGSLYCNFCGKKQEATPKKRARKRAHGSGTITKDSRYAKPYIVHAPATPNGRRTYIGCYKTYLEAQKALEDYCINGRSDLYNATFEMMYKLWSDKHFNTLDQISINHYTSMAKRLEPLFKYKIADLKTVDYQKIVDASTSKATAQVVRSIAVMVCKYACENDVIEKNYAEFVTLPKFSKSEKVIFTSDQISVLWEHSADKRVQTILVMIYTGFRIGEILAIRPKDIDFINGYITGGEKTEAGKNRKVPFPENIPEIKTFVQEWCVDVPADRPIFDKYDINTFRNVMFYDCLIDLGLLKARKLRKCASSGYEFLESPHLTPHSTRHTYASLSASAGMRPDVLQKLIGHADFNTTANVYIHNDIDQLRNEMNKLKK